MAEPRQNRTATLAWGLLVVWAGAYGWSILGPFFVIAPTGDGFTRGLNRVGALLIWQSIAAALAIVLWFLGNGFASRATRWLFRVPLLLALALVLFVVGLILWANFMRPSPDPVPINAPVTVPAPAADAVPVAPE